MSQIAILPDILINKIAAGEVIERPASIVRELIDNSIDAGATKIDIDVLHGGKKLIKVVDNGSGMDRDDALICFERHATSKITSEDDLSAISTLGFRGEALSSIASVSKVVLITSRKGTTYGVRIELGSNKKKDVRDAPALHGTSLEVRDLFYNTPARRKFLKTIPTELSHIIETVTQKAFAYPDRAFSLRHNEKEILSVSPASSIQQRFAQLFGQEFADQFLSIRTESRQISLSGFCSSPDFVRGSRSHQHVYVNTRPVKNPTVSHAVYSAYGNLLSGSKHPSFFLFLYLDLKIVDVNVHPAKREVKFERPEEIHRLVASTISEALHPGFHMSPSVSSRRTHTEVDSLPVQQPARTMLHNKDFMVKESLSAFNARQQEDIFSTGLSPDRAEFFSIGEAFIARVHDNGLQLIDQHAAHERVLYENLLKKSSIEGESLFLPLRIELPLKEFTVIIKHLDILRTLGLDIDDFGAHNVIIRSIPRELKKADIKSLLLDIADGILQKETSGLSVDMSEEALLKDMAARLACHKSVRGGARLTKEELSHLMSALEKTEVPDRCPHGRPTRIQISLGELRKMFRRK